MKLINLRSLILTFLCLSVAFSASAILDVDAVDRCNTVEIFGTTPDKSIKIVAFKGTSSATKGMAFVKLPGKDDLTVKGFKYLLDGMEEGCFGVIENFSANGRRYPIATLIVASSADSDGVTVEYSISADDENLYSGSFRLKGLKVSNPISDNDNDKAGYTDADWAGAYADFGLWLICHVEQYKE